MLPLVPQVVYTPSSAETRPLGLDGISMYSKGSLDFYNAVVQLKSASIFTSGNVFFNPYSSGYLKTSGQNASSFASGQDPYADWDTRNLEPPSEMNTTPRPGNNVSPGIGAAGRICGVNKPGGSGVGNCDQTWVPKIDGLGSRHFDSKTSPRFVESPTNPQPSGQITFPFDETAIDANIEALTAELKETAKSQTVPALPISKTSPGVTVEGNYVRVDGSSKNLVQICRTTTHCVDGSQPTIQWPEPTASTPWPVVYVEFVGGGGDGQYWGNRVRWSAAPSPGVSAISGNPADVCADLRSKVNAKKGILVVENAGFRWEGGGPLFPLEGGIITKNGPQVQGKMTSGTDNMCVTGPVIAGGAMYLQNSTGFAALSDSEFNELPGFGGSDDSGSDDSGSDDSGSDDSGSDDSGSDDSGSDDSGSDDSGSDDDVVQLQSWREVYD